MTTVSRRTLGEQLQAKLAPIPNLSIYPGEVEKTPPTISADDLRVKPYIVLHPSPGYPSLDVRLDGTHVGLTWGFQITCVSGISFDVLSIVDVVDAALDGWRPDPSMGRCRLNPDVDPGPVRSDIGQTPTRFWIPLLYVIHA